VFWTIDYYTNDETWLRVNIEAIQTFPDVLFFPGFWSEYGMCGEPSAFGSKPVWSQNAFPHSEKIINDISEIKNISKPNPRSDGLLPFLINRLRYNEHAINQFDHKIKFAVSRGPLNIVSFLMGTTEFVLACKMNPEEISKLISLITDFIIDWIDVQIETFPSIDGIFLLDDLIGFFGKEDFKEFGFNYFKKIYDTFNVKVKFLHNDAQGLESAPFLHKMGINLFNFSFNHSFDEMLKLTDDSVVLLGNIPPRDVLANGKPEGIKTEVEKVMESVKGSNRIILSCGGGMPPDVSTENIHAFINVVNDYEG
jgi:uroporphyrinogen decarboxylase